MSDGNIGAALLITILLIGINGMLASAELAMIGLSEHRLRQKAEEGDRSAKRLLRMKENPSGFLSTVQIGITLAGLLSGAFAADTLAEPLMRFIAIQAGVTGTALTILDGAVTFFITLLMTFFMLVFGELVPKRIAMVRPESTARRVTGLIHSLSKITKPLVALLTVSTNAVLRMLGVDAGQREAVTEEDVLLLMREGRNQGRIEEVEVQVLQNLFAFTDLRVEDAMTHRTKLETLPADGTLSQVVDLMGKTGHNKFPVIDGSVDRIIGMLYSKDIIAHYPLGDPLSPPPLVRDLMRQPCFVPEQKLLTELFSDMKRSGERVAVVVDDYGGTSGIITLMDILEEIVGDIDHPGEGRILPLEDGGYRIDGLMESKTVFLTLGLDLPGDHSGTLSGFLIERLGYIPHRDAHPELILADWRFRVEEMTGGRIRWIRAEPVTVEPES